MKKPDFTGKWTLNDKASALSPTVAPVVQRGFVRIEHQEPRVSVHLSITMDEKPFDVRFERPSNWDGDALVFTDRTETPNGELTISFCYERLDAGRRLRATEHLRGAGREQDNVWVFDRCGARSGRASRLLNGRRLTNRCSRQPASLVVENLGGDA